MGWGPGARRVLGALGLALALVACGRGPGTTAIPELRSGTLASADQLPPIGMTVQQEAAHLANNLSLDDKLGQFLIIQFTDKDYTPLQAELVQQFHPGGVILYDYDMGTADQVRGLLSGAQADSPIPMLAMSDLEGGGVDHIASYTTAHISAPEMAASGNPQVAYQAGVKFAHDLQSLNFNMDLAPDVDVALVNGPDQWNRTFGTTPQPVITYAGAFLTGLQAAGVIGTIKHFPGLGAATTDAHTDLPEIDRSRAQLEATEFAPYRALIASGAAQVVMSTDLLMPALDPNLPAELSRPIITGVLRDELHFNGVAITDALYMAGVSDRFSFVQAAVMAIEAGNDMIMAPYSTFLAGGIVDQLKADIASGVLSMAQVNASVERILALKIRFHLLPGPRPQKPGLQDEPTADMRRLAATA